MHMHSVTKLCLSLCYPVDCSLPNSSAHVISQAQEEYRSGLAFPPLGDLPDPGMEPESPALAGGFFTLSHLGSTLPQCS